MPCSTRSLLHTRDEQLVARARQGDRAAQRLLVERHLPLVRAIASRYRDLGLPFDDLVQEGSIGLLEGIDRFDPRRGSAFSTFAYWRVRGAISRALTRNGHLLRLPKQVIERRHTVFATSARLATGNGHEPSAAEIAAATGLSTSAVVEALEAPTAIASLDKQAADGGTTLEALVEDPVARDPADEALVQETEQLVSDAVAQLPPRRRFVIRRHFGLDCKAQSLTEIAAELELSAQKTRAIKDRALHDLARVLKPRSPERAAGAAPGRIGSALRRRGALLPRVLPVIAAVVAKASALLVDRGGLDPPL
jgi:RNA polymerase primary sigma factor